MGPSVRRSFFALVWLVFASVFGAGVKSDASGSIEATLPQSATVGSVAPAQDAVARLHALFDREWERSMREQPTWASSLGDRRYNDRWPDESLDAIERRQREDVAVLEELATIDRDSLPADEQLNYDLFRLEYEEKVEGQQFHSFLIPLSERGGIQTADGLHEILRFETAKDFEDWIARLHRIGPYVDQTLALMERGLAEAWVPPRITMEGVTEQIAAQIVDSPEKSPFYDPFEIFPADFPEQEQERLRAAGIAAISEIVIPAYRRLQTFYTERYLPGIRETVGAWDLPGGSAFYSHQAWASTTTRLTPEEIHEIGLGEVERIHIEMERIMAEVGFQGTFEEFLDFLRTDRRFYYEKPEDLFDGYLTICKRIDPELVKLFGRLPRAPYGVRAIPETIAPYTTTAYYNPPAADGSRPGWFYVNLYKPEMRPKYEMEVLSAHEAVPGHHLQIALAQELGELPNFRRYGGHTAFIEGWGLYSESLGEELGLYQDPYSKFGQLTYEMWRAVRLVVDTGLHYYRWDRQKAIDYFKANTAKTELDIVNEVDRYISLPGQALAYKIGELKILELRQRAKERLGERFDIRGFHDTVLGSGSVPLDVLEQLVDDWIERTSMNADG